MWVAPTERWALSCSKQCVIVLMHYFFFQGSTCYKIAESLRLSGVRTGLFVSPHLSSIRERMQVNSELIPEDTFVGITSTLFQLCIDNEIPCTQFELEFLTASMYFKLCGCEAVVLEVSAVKHSHGILTIV